MVVVATKFSPVLNEWVSIPLFESHRNKPCKEWADANCESEIFHGKKYYSTTINGEKWDVELWNTKFHKNGS